MYKIMHGLLDLLCDAVFAIPIALGFVAILSAFTNSGVTASMRLAFE